MVSWSHESRSVGFCQKVFFLWFQYTISTYPWAIWRDYGRVWFWEWICLLEYASHQSRGSHHCSLKGGIFLSNWLTLWLKLWVLSRSEIIFNAMYVDLGAEFVVPLFPLALKSSLKSHQMTTLFVQNEFLLKWWVFTQTPFFLMTF